MSIKNVIKSLDKNIVKEIFELTESNEDKKKIAKEKGEKMKSKTPPQSSGV